MKTGAEWQCVKIVCRPLSPIHIGWHRLGLIERTRYYIPARNVWGAMVAALAGSMHAERGVPGMYAAAQTTAKQALRVTYLFPGNGADLWRPSYESGELCYGSKKPARLEADLVYSEASAAIAPQHFTALDGALHETEYLDPRGIHFTGYIFFREPLGLRHLAPALRFFEVGGERRYGWGALTCDNPSRTKEAVFKQFTLLPSRGELRLRAKPPFTLPAHLIARTSQNHFQGELEAHSGRNWGNGLDRVGAGQDVLLARLCWTPGTFCPGSDERTFTIRSQGLWEEIEPAPHPA